MMSEFDELERLYEKVAAGAVEPEDARRILELERQSKCRYCGMDTSEYDDKFATVCGACRDEAEGEGVFFDLDDNPYRDGPLGPWIVSDCCYAYAKGTEVGIVCRHCYHLTDHIDGRANLGREKTGDRFGRTP